MRWSRQRWVLTTLVILAGQLLAIFALHTRQPLLAKLPPFTPGPVLASATNSSGSVPQELNDPLLFAGAHPLGFSGAVWLKRPQMEIAFSNSIPPVRYLAFQPSGPEISETNVFRRPLTPLPFLQIALPQRPAPRSLLTVEGDLATRPVLNKPVPPNAVGADVLSDTIVRIGVRRDGFPQSLRVVAGSGTPAMDVSALQMAHGIRFAPQVVTRAGQEDALEWGELVFQWHTAAPGTNNPAISPAK